ncbi:MAG: hypothetical protein H6817_09245, partial [Phycisphaerales bacterium]|nr:hypothetical protein [Phycisphaerales bacterium]
MLTSSLMSLDALLCLIALVGLVLLGFGVKGRRVGDEPRCRKCGYNLTGATAQVCSECGKTIDAQGVVFGVRRRRKLAILLGVLCVLPISGRWSVKGYQYAQTVNRYQFYPFSWVLADSGGGEAEALDEVDRRLRSGRLNATQSAQLAIAALKKQGATTADGQTQQWVDMLEFLYQAGDLSGDQTTTYFAQMRTYALKVRDQVCEGEGIPFRISYAGRGPSFAIRGDVGDGRWTDVSVESGRVLLRRIDGVDVRGPTYAVEAYIVSSDMGPTVGRTGSCESVLRSPTAPPGRYELTLDLEEKVNPQGVLGPVREGPRVSTRNVKVTQQIEVLSFDEC